MMEVGKFISRIWMISYAKSIKAAVVVVIMDYTEDSMLTLVARWQQCSWTTQRDSGAQSSTFDGVGPAGGQLQLIPGWVRESPL